MSSCCKDFTSNLTSNLMCVRVQTKCLTLRMHGCRTNQGLGLTRGTSAVLVCYVIAVLAATAAARVSKAATENDHTITSTLVDDSRQSGLVQQLESALLTNLGFSSKPRLSRPGSRPFVPPYVMDLYKQRRMPSEHYANYSPHTTIRSFFSQGNHIIVAVIGNTSFA
jgi:hypothetical protein